jgi:hypothetical protein
VKLEEGETVIRGSRDGSSPRNRPRHGVCRCCVCRATGSSRLVMSSPFLTGPTRPIHTAARKGDLDEITRLLASGEPVDPRDGVSLPLSSLSHLFYSLGTPLSSLPVAMVNPMPPLFSSRGELLSISRTRSPHSLSSLSHLLYRLGGPLSCMPVAMVTPQLSLFSSRGERLLI